MDVRIDSPTRRNALPIRREPYWHKLQKGGYLGFRRIADNGTWIARWRTEAGKHEYNALRLPTMARKDEFEAASKAARAWFKEKEAGVTGRWRVEDAGKHYVADRRVEKGDAAASDAEGRIRRLILPTLGRKYLDRLKSGDIKDWLHAQVLEHVNDEKQARRAKASANRNLATLKAILNSAWRAGRVASREEWSKVKAFKSEDTHNPRNIFLESDQRRALREHCTGAFGDLVDVALLTGARYGELQKLRAGDYDATKRRLSITRGKTGPREVPLSSEAAALLSRLKENKLPGAFLFTKDDGTPWLRSDQRYLMRDAVAAAKLPRATVFYVLRHTFIANALTGGVPIHQVAKLCGTSVKMIEQHYDKFLHSDAEERLNKVSFL